MEGHGTETSPYISGTTEVLTPSITLKDSQHIQAVVEYDFDADENGERQVSDNIDPVIHIGTINSLIGKVLTLVDATFSDETQRKAARGLFMNTVWEWYGLPDSVRDAWRKDKYPDYEKGFDKINDDRSVK